MNDKPRSRRRADVYERWLEFDRLRLQGLSLPKIAKRFGMHHTTVWHGLRELRHLRQNYPEQLERFLKC